MHPGTCETQEKNQSHQGKVIITSFLLLFKKETMESNTNTKSVPDPEWWNMSVVTEREKKDGQLIL